MANKKAQRSKGTKGEVNYQKKLQKLVDQHEIHGDMQSFFGKRYSNSGTGTLFEHQTDEDAEAIYTTLEEIGVEAAISFYNGFYGKEDSSLQSPTSSKENEVSTSANADQGESQHNGGAVATTPGSSQTTAAPSFQLREAYNAETDKIVLRTPEQQKRSLYLWEQISGVEKIQWAAISLLLEDEGHLDLGYKSREEFYNNAMGVSRHTASRKLNNGRFLLSLLPGEPKLDVAVLQQVNNLPDVQKETFYKFAALDDGKIKDLADAEEADYTEVLSSAIVKFSDGREVSLEDIEMRTRNEANKLLKGEIDGYKKRNSDLLTKNSEQEAELKQKKKELDAVLSKLETAEHLDLMYGSKKATIEGLETLIKNGEELARMLNKCLTRIELPGDAPDDLEMQVVSLHRIIADGITRLKGNNRQAFAGATETRTVELNGEVVDEETGEILN